MFEALRARPWRGCLTDATGLAVWYLHQVNHIGATPGRIASLFAAFLVLGCGEVTSTLTDAAEEPSDGGGGDSPDGSGDAADAAGGDLACPSDQRCLDDVPSGWEGPATLGEESSCPSSYPDAGDLVHAGLNAPAATCGCGCFVSGVDCRLIASVEQGGGLFEPQGSCDSPPVQDACLTVDAVASCETTPSSQIPDATWDTDAQVCSGATAGDSCEGGTCFPSAGEGAALCIVREGDHACPESSGFSERTLFHRDVTDTRGCSACSCEATDQVCEMELQICSVGFYEVTLSSGGDEECLNSSDGDGVTLLSQSVTNGGSCTTSGADATGSALPADPVTICCTP
jgi:hypothetical protein